MFRLGSLHSVHCCYCHKEFLAEPGKQEDWCLNAACESCAETQEILTGCKGPTLVPIMWLYQLPGD